MKEIPIRIMNDRELKEKKYYTIDKSLMMNEFLDTKIMYTEYTKSIEPFDYFGKGNSLLL